MAKNNGKVPGTFVSDKEMNELGQLLATFREYILSHEARIELIENWIGEFHKHYSENTEPEMETDGPTEAEGQTLPEGARILTAPGDEVWDLIEAQTRKGDDNDLVNGPYESTDNPEEG